MTYNYGSGLIFCRCVVAELDVTWIYHVLSERARVTRLIFYLRTRSTKEAQLGEILERPPISRLRLCSRMSAQARPTVWTSAGAYSFATDHVTFDPVLLTLPHLRCGDKPQMV